MPTKLEEVAAFYDSTDLPKRGSIQAITPGAGERQYFRITSITNDSVVAVHSSNIRETASFLKLSEVFQTLGAPVPIVTHISPDKTIYFQEDLGNFSLLDILKAEGESDRVKQLYKKALTALMHLQINAHKAIAYGTDTVATAFDAQAVLNDLNYFKYYFLDTLPIAYDRESLSKEFNALAAELGNAEHQHFMYRDFQARNIMVKNDEVFFIDFQGGMKGPMQYDLASLLWQTRANLSAAFKQEMLDHYIGETEKQISIDRKRFIGEYNGFVFLRLLQVLGAYGFRGLFQKKEQFISSIAETLRSLKAFCTGFSALDRFPVLKTLIHNITADDVIKRFEPLRATADTPLLITVQSFSFLKTGYPKETSTHGGGFVFDCRGILNPGRVEEHKQQTGRDEPVQQYLNTHTRMAEFLTGVYSVIDIAVEDYIKRGFDHLTINFGCTGGQHRSVFAADATAKHLKEKYGVKTRVKHLEQNFAD